MTTVLYFTTFAMALGIVSFGLSQAWLAFNYQRSKGNGGGRAADPAWPGQLPTVLMQLPIFNERYVVERLLRAVALLDYPPDKLTIQLLDDSTDDTTAIAARVIAELNKAGANIHHIRRADRSGFKAGALQAGLALDNSEFITIFDADFIPQPDFIKRIIGYFANPKVGMVQTRWDHLNANYSTLTKILSFGIDAHFSMEQGGRQASESFINFNGTAGMWRRKTIDDAGGWSSDCLTEDLDLSFRSQLRGWKFLFVESISTPSELPVELSAIRSQQFRWTKGAAEVGRKMLPNFWRSNEPLSRKVVGTFHMLNSLIFPGVFVFSILAACYPLAYGANAERAFAPIGLMLLIGTVSIVFAYATAQTHGHFEHRNSQFLHAVYSSFMFMFLTSGLGLHNSIAVMQGLLGRKTAFVRTPKLNILADDHKVTTNRAYKLKFLTLGFLFEALATALFLGLTAFSLWNGYLVLLSVYAYFAAGYVMVIYFTLEEVFATRAQTKAQNMAKA
ncbi:MAG: glycosyltransferase [Alphaproteobacteria bacterium]|nr:glycosyltransferase [Alphaproteobacteria bacterium]